MEVILLERIEKLGSVGDVVKVKDGYGRNFLIPQNKALRATKENKSIFEARRAEIELQNVEKRTAAQAVAKHLDKLIVTLIMQAGEDGRLFGSVNTRNIAAAVEQAGVNDVLHRHIVINDAIKFTGVYPVKVTLHAEVVETIYVNIARSETEAIEARKEFLNPTVKKTAGELAQEKAEAEAARYFSKQEEKVSAEAEGEENQAATA